MVARGPLLTAAIGDGSTDIPMLAAVDIPVLLGTQITAELPHLHHIPMAGPRGWQQAVQHILATITQ
jgi:predicted mannosyl-3-phosphoglycerate phosphatase (HAD superfamily)